MLSPLGPALQFGGGSKVISASSFWILFKLVPIVLEDLGVALGTATGGWESEGLDPEELVPGCAPSSLATGVLLLLLFAVPPRDRLPLPRPPVPFTVALSLDIM